MKRQNLLVVLAALVTLSGCSWHRNSDVFGARGYYGPGSYAWQPEYMYEQPQYLPALYPGDPFAGRRAAPRLRRRNARQLYQPTPLTAGAWAPVGAEMPWAGGQMMLVPVNAWEMTQDPCGCSPAGEITPVGHPQYVTQASMFMSVPEQSASPGLPEHLHMPTCATPVMTPSCAVPHAEPQCAAPVLQMPSCEAPLLMPPGCDAALMQTPGCAMPAFTMPSVPVPSPAPPAQDALKVFEAPAAEEPAPAVDPPMQDNGAPMPPPVQQTQWIQEAQPVAVPVPQHGRRIMSRQMVVEPAAH